MRRPARTLRRALLAPALMLCLVLAASVPAAAYTPPNDYQTGQIGHYDFDDYAIGSHDGNVDCDYHVYSNGQRRLTKFVFRLPRIWWFDTNSSTTHEHGTVGWQYRVQKSTDPDSVPFSTVFTSSVQKHTAHEDHPGFSDGDRAPFTTRTLNWSSGQTESYRIKYTITWYQSDGTVKGTLSHWYQTYDSNDNANPVNGFCENKYTEL
jgi:hypothetical protein